MEIEVITIGEDKKEYIRIGCHRVDSNIKEIVRFITKPSFICRRLAMSPGSDCMSLRKLSPGTDLSAYRNL